jgi:hypothetical protein
MIQGDFHGSIGPKPVGFSGGQFRLVIEPLDDAAGDRALGAEPVEEQGAMSSQHLGDPFHRLHLRTHGLRCTSRPGTGWTGCQALG